MSWMSQLLKTYESSAGRRFEEYDSQMTPIAHMYANAQMEVTLNENGDFLGVMQGSFQRGDPDLSHLVRERVTWPDPPT